MTRTSLSFMAGLLLAVITVLVPRAQAQDSPVTAYQNLLREAQAKVAAKDYAAAQPLWEKVVEANPHERRNWIGYASALYEAKEYRKAIVAYQKWIELGASYPWDAPYNIACCYALLGDKENALKWLEQALELGYRNLQHARTDEDFASLRDHPKYREMVALADTGKMTRDEGWRYDLMFLARELKRVHFDPFKKVSKEEFDGYVKKLHADIPKLSDAQVTVGLMKLLQMMGDGHTTMRQAQATPSQLPLQFYLFTEGLYITAAAPEHAELAGARVLKFGDAPVDKVLAAMESIVSRDNSIWVKFIGVNLMRTPLVLNGLGLIPAADKVALTIIDAKGETRAVTVAAGPGGPNASWVTARKGATLPDPLTMKNRQAPYWFEYLADSKTVFFQYNSVQNMQGEPLTAFCDRLFKFINENDVERLVIDMRWNSGGNNFLNRPIVHGLIRNEKINRRGKLFVIVGRQTFSAAMNGATDIERHANAIFVGEPTGSSPNFVGETVGFQLPYSKLTGSISDLYWQSSVAMDFRTWIAPTVYAPPSFELFRQNRDPAMEAILNYRDSQ